MSDQPNVTKKNDTVSESDTNIPHVNRSFAITVITVFVAMLLLPTIVWGVLTMVSPKTVDALSFDTGENRALAKFPEEFDPQTFTSEIEAWYNDHLPFRSVLYKTQENMENRLEKSYKTHMMPVLIDIFHSSDDPTPQNPNEDLLLNPFEETTELTALTETETLPQFETETEEPGVQTCQHVYSDEQVTLREPTCSDWGIIGYQCQYCEAVGNKEYTAKAAHSYLSDVAALPLCGTKYDETLTCENCGDSNTYTRTKQHTPGQIVKTVEPTESNYGYELIQCAECSGEYRTALQNRLPIESYLPPISQGNALEGHHNWLFYLGDNSINYYQGNNHLTIEQLDEYVAILQQLNDICRENGIQFAVCFWPNKELVYSEFMPDYPIYETIKRVQHLTDYINANSDVTAVYPLAQLRSLKPYWQVYYKHDTHWSSSGAFIGMQEMYKAMGFDTSSLMALPVIETAKAGGDLIGIGGLNRADYTGDVNYSITYRPDVTVIPSQTAPVNSETSHSTSNGIYDLNFVMLSDSFRVAMRPFLEKDFTSCFLTHRNRVHDADVVAAIKEADVLVISGVERYDYSVISTAQTIISILSEKTQ